MIIIMLMSVWKFAVKWDNWHWHCAVTCCLALANCFPFNYSPLLSSLPSRWLCFEPASLHQASASALHYIVLVRSQFKLSSTRVMVDSIEVVWSLVTLASCSSVLGSIQNDFDSGLEASVMYCRWELHSWNDIDSVTSVTSLLKHLSLSRVMTCSLVMTSHVVLFMGNITQQLNIGSK